MFLSLAEIKDAFLLFYNSLSTVSYSCILITTIVSLIICVLLQKSETTFRFFDRSVSAIALLVQ